MDSKLLNIIATYLEEHQQLLNSKNFDALYNEIDQSMDCAYNRLKIYTCVLTQIFINAQLNPLDYMHSIPDYYMACDFSPYDISYKGEIVVNIPNNITSIGEEAFYKCTNLTSIAIPNSVVTIDRLAFSGCTSLTSVTIPDSVEHIGSGLFFGCTKLANVDIGSKLNSIGTTMFFNCIELQHISLPTNITSIGVYAFDQCYKLESVEIPNSVIAIGYGAFHDCKSLTSISFRGTKVQWHDINKQPDWCKGSSIKLIKCVDGDIELK